MIGRRSELEEISGLVKSPVVRLVTLNGPGGVGKTSLALAVAHENASAFADGAYLVELSGVGRPADVAPALARALAVTPREGQAVHDALQRFLVSKQLLLVLDNFEHVLPAAGLIAQLLEDCPRLTALVTSREALNLGAEHRLLVAPLLVPPLSASTTELEATDASALFLAAARRHDNRFALSPRTAPYVAEICARLDGLPLALELAAARTKLIDAEDLAIQLRRELTALGVGARDAPARQRTLHATIEWSYGLLDEEERRAFVHFAVFVDGASPAAAETVARRRRSRLLSQRVCSTGELRQTAARGS